MGAEGKQRKRKRSVAEPRAPGADLRAKGRPGKDVATEPSTQHTAIVIPRRLAAKRVSRQSDDGPHDGTASSSACSVVPSGEADLALATGAAVHVCGHCERRFRSPGKLAQHERVHTRDAAFYCSFCPKWFSGQSDAAIHERAHTGKKPYACSICPKRFNQKTNVPRHERTHTGEKPYACSMCPKRFSDKGAVPRHERTHTGEKPYACSMCPRRFRDWSNAACHERTH